MQLNTADMQEALDPNQADPDPPTDPHNTLDYANNEEALCMSRFRNRPWIDVLEETPEKRRHEGACILCGEQSHFINKCPKCQVGGRAMWTIDNHQDTLNHGPDFDVFSALATHLCAMALSLDTSSAHLLSQSSQILLLHITLPHSTAPVSTLVDSSATNNFIDKSLATLATTPQKLPLPICLTLFNGNSTSAVARPPVACDPPARLHPLILGLLWLRSTNLYIDWWNLTLHFDCQATEHPEPIPFDVTTPVSATDHPHTPPQLCSKSTWSFVLNARLGESPQILTALIDSGATRTPMELQLFDGKPTIARPITKSHTSSITLNNGLQFLVHLLVTQLPEVTPIVLGLLWLHDVNPDIDWKDLTMKFLSTGACLAAVSLCLQPTNNPSEARATGDPTAPPNNSGETPSTQHTLSTPPVFSSNIPCNKYKGPRYPAPCPWKTLDPGDTDQPSKSLNPDTLDIKIISPAPFAHIIQDGTPAFQLHISLALPEEHLSADTMALELKTEEQILHEVVPLEYHEFADVFSKGSAKELPPH
ncbi:hypothetical protein C0993_005951 [Termitomyces sp. T159_Od127]|nr:hypothetical protein C0993_005951 [Termitomyces sp. T159_Od127]